MSDVARWLDARTPAMPDGLRTAVDAALARSDGGGVADGDGAVPARLAAAALSALERLARAEPEGRARSSAAELLAADALLTYACEAAAEAGPGALDGLLAELDFARFEALLAGEAA